jgi:RNA polymerase sigma-70 factor (ECF subfamily)
MPLADAIRLNMPDQPPEHLNGAGDRDPLARFRAGDREAFTLIYRLHSPAVFRFAMHMTGDRMKAAEITQDVFVWLIHHSGNYDAARGELGAFLLGVTRKLLLRLLRNERKWVPLDEVGKAAGKALSTSPTARTDDSHTAWLREAIGALPVRYREVVVLCDLEGHTYEDAAGALDCAVGTVRSRLHRARELLGRKLQSRKETEGCTA